MLTPDDLEHAPDGVAKLMQELEDDILRDVARRIGKMDAVTDTAKWQLWRLSQVRGLRKEIIKLLARYCGRTETEIRQLLSDSGTIALEEDDQLYRAAGRTPPPVNDSPALVNLLNAGYRQTRGTWQNLTATTANTVTGQFEAMLDRAWLQVSSGAFDYKTAIKRAVDDLARDMTYVTYPSGHRDTLEVAARRAVLTGVNQTSAKLQIARMEEMDWEFIETTAHPGARPEHAVWQGKVFHRGGAVTVDGVRYPDFVASTGYGTGPGLCGWNCHHHIHAFFPGLSKPAYTEEQLATLNARDMEYNGKMYTRYELSQMQRGLERRVRKRKRQYLAEEAAGADTTQAAVKLRAAREQLKQFSRQTGLDLDGSRIGVSGFGRSQASRANWSVRKKAQEALARQEKRATLQAEVRAQIQAGEIPSRLNRGNQNKHIPGSPGYLPGRSIIYGDLETAQALVDRYKGTGDIRLTEAGDWTHKEFITADTVIGVTIDPETGQLCQTRRFAIHYGKRGAHIVPREEEKK